MSIIRLENVSYTYRGAEAPAVKGADCAFETGRMYAIIGPSGSGKSTLLSMLAGLDLPTEGDVYFGEEKLRDMDLDRYRREDIAMIFQAFHLFPLMTVEENVCYPMELCGMHPKEAKERARPLLEGVGIQKEKHGRFPSNLSGGEQQRVAIARALSSGAKVILADEPTGNLDDENTAAIMALLRKQATDKGYCVIIVTHDPEVAAACDVQYRMLGGTLIPS